ncbi:LA2681 family HEPN domain-containing protein [Pseudomonas sp. BF-R-12]|uniref:LA2681 family HEPN domain-containing protein n=1 Tax=Pseudomonas sp. BF-R-12 TaxID=2832363 RepID=UPI001CC00BE9|nr:LA2681 family HEPN domain-containing protein [Pseudomonas sp. BF-R-12]
MTDKALNNQEIDKISQKMDLLIETSSTNLINYCQTVQKKKGETEFLTAQLYYTVGTGYYSAYRAIIADEWSSPHIKRAIYYLRKALHELSSQKDKYYSFESHKGLAHYSTAHLRSKISINLANYLTEQHRHLEALEFYDLAIDEKNAFGLTTKARCLIEASNSIYDKNSRFFFYKQSYKLLKAADSPENVSTPGEQDLFEQLSHRLNHYCKWFESQYPEFLYTDHSDTYKEKFMNRKHKSYLDWVGRNKLFLNFTNNIITEEYAYEDCLYLPSFSGKINHLLLPSEELAYHSHFEEIKDTYKYARYLFHTALQIPIETEHMYNSTTSQVESYDSTFYDLKTNHYRTVLRCLYSIQDKIAYFIYKFFKVSNSEIPEHKVNINSIFSSNQKPAAWLSEVKNPYLRALYFLSQDIHDTGEKNSTTNKDPNANLFLADINYPRANIVNKIRNALEHKSLKIVDSFGYELSQRPYNPENTLKAAEIKLRELDPESGEHKELVELIEEKKRLQSYGEAISIEDLEQQIMDLFKMSKTAMMYLALSIHHQEKSLPDDDTLIASREVPYR